MVAFGDRREQIQIDSRRAARRNVGTLAACRIRSRATEACVCGDGRHTSIIYPTKWIRTPPKMPRDSAWYPSTSS